MLLYTKEILDEIESHFADKSFNRFKIKDNTFIFTKSSKEGIYIQRVSNFALGLAYDTTNKQFIFNYPHLSNIKTVSDVPQNSIVQEKLNGTNVGIIKLADGSIIYRTRGSIEPDTFMNNINSAILEGAKTLVGINEEVFDDFKNKYIDILREGIKKYIDDFGNVLMTSIGTELVNELKYIFIENWKIVGIFGELISKYNPIAVDSKMKFGMYLDMPEDYQFYIFDIMVTDNGGNIYFAEPSELKLIRKTKLIKTVSSEKLSDINAMQNKFINEEGVIAKSSEGYYKIKKDEVLEWERLLGKLSNVVVFSINHVFEENGFSTNEVLNKKFLEPNAIEPLILSSWQEIKNNGVSENDLIEYYGSKNKVDTEIKSIVSEKVLIGIASVLIKNNITTKEKLYLALPEYFQFTEPVLDWNERRGKLLPIKSYALMIRKIIGNVVGK
jgi:hypothetical protein